MFHIEGEKMKGRQKTAYSREKEKMSGGSIERYSFLFRHKDKLNESPSLSRVKTNTAKKLCI